MEILVFRCQGNHHGDGGHLQMLQTSVFSRTESRIKLTLGIGRWSNKENQASTEHEISTALVN